MSKPNPRSLNQNCIYMIEPKEAAWVGWPFIDGKGQTDCGDLGYDYCESCNEWIGEEE